MQMIHAVPRLFWYRRRRPTRPFSSHLGKLPEVFGGCKQISGLAGAPLLLRMGRLPRPSYTRTEELPSHGILPE